MALQGTEHMFPRNPRSWKSMLRPLSHSLWFRGNFHALASTGARLDELPAPPSLGFKWKMLTDAHPLLGTPAGRGARPGPRELAAPVEKRKMDNGPETPPG